MKKILIPFGLLILAFVIYFKLNPSTQTTYDFYHWHSVYEVEEGQKSPKYVKVLDISFNETLAFRQTTLKTKLPSTTVPVIYIDNPLWKKMRASIMVRKVLSSLKSMGIESSEIQVDCDWTDGSRERYFRFLKLLKEQSAKKVSATIRLHQVKYYEQRGVPPVDYGVLMYYNMSDFKDLATKNYILDLNVAKRYHYNFESYPLALNLALPLYSQATIIRFGEVVGLMEGVREKELNLNFKKIGKHLFEVTNTHYFKKRLLYKGDQIRVDEVSATLLTQSIMALKKVMKEPKKIIFYRWGNKGFYGDEKLRKIVNQW
jgi:hypothetical protein